MNLYRSFGNLMEVWVTEGAPEPDWLERNEEDPPSPSSDVDTNVRSESVDSGVETASSDISFPTTSVSVDLDTFTPLASQSPVLSFPAPLSSTSSSPYLMPNRSKVEQALLRVESFREKRQEAPVDDVVRRRPLSSLLPKRHTSDLARGQRPGSIVLRKASSSSPLVRQMSEAQRRPQSAIYDRETFDYIPKVLTEKSELSPGLQYLEQVCQMLEEYAREQLHHNTQHTEAIEEEQVAGTCDFETVEKEEPLCRNLEKTQVEPSSSEPQQKRERPFGHFRQRSASDTNLASLHLRRLKVDYEEYKLSAHDLQETAAEEEQENQDCLKDDLNKSKNYWRFKFGSMRKVDEKKSPQMLPSATRRRLSHLFRRRRKTGPI
ncbi:hypothetical protein NL108_002046 [Boleophthalmus pectinirostris]|uniref:uncharacterized protein si:dkey-106l3.7 n=1 Tax=Boleophthalmus pectinirostris TaxID=150288 RepID=UPI000A1C38D9|nr:uncharacterized protein si:dkey-106l3.7 [Boleophthalmus pectinirostris]KAJ0057110.1 hypothetical protein NL108_002046 [Boleophthalmus pectinirostris]